MKRGLLPVIRLVSGTFFWLSLTLTLFLGWELARGLSLSPKVIWCFAILTVLALLGLVSGLTRKGPTRRVVMVGTLGFAALFGIFHGQWAKRELASTDRALLSQRGSHCNSMVMRYVLSDSLSGPLFWFGYTAAILDDVCRGQKILDLTKSKLDRLCPETQSPVACFNSVVGEATEKAPFTVVGSIVDIAVGVALVSHEMALEKRNIGTTEAGIKGAINTLISVNHWLDRFEKVLRADQMKGYQADYKSPFQSVVVTMDNGAYGRVKRDIPHHIKKLVDDADKGFNEFIQKVTLERQAPLIHVYKEQRQQLKIKTGNL